MNRVQRLEQEVQSLSDKERTAFREWFVEFDWNTWDSELELDIDQGELDSLAEVALNEHREGLTNPL